MARQLRGEGDTNSRQDQCSGADIFNYGSRSRSSNGVSRMIQILESKI